MNDIRKAIGLIVLVTSAAFALPAIAAKGNGTDKAYSLIMDEQAVYDPAPDAIRNVRVPVQVQASLTNEAPPSTSASNVGSFELIITNPGVTIFVDADHRPTGTTDGVSNGSIAVVADPVTNAKTRLVITNMSPLKGKKTYVLTFWVTSCGDALWDANVRTGASLSGDTFTRIKDNIDPSTHLATNLQTLISCGTLACGNTIDLVGDKASQSPELVVTRGPYNSDGSCSATSEFFASNKLLTGSGQVHFRWPVGDADQKLSVWTYDVVSTNASVPKLAWLNSDGTKASTAFPDPTVQPPQVPAYIDGLQCQTTNGQAGVLPAPYGVLSNNANLSTGTIKVNTSPQNAVLPTPTPEFDIVIGTERMRVKAIQGSTWTVDRQTGLTTPSTHPAGAKVMSTPLPLLPAGVPAPYIEGKQAQMCVVGSPTPVTPATNPPMWSTTIIDLSDGWVRIGGF